MGDSLPAINVDQLTDSVNNAVHGNLLPPLPVLEYPPSPHPFSPPLPPPPPPPPPLIPSSPRMPHLSSFLLPGSGFTDGSPRLFTVPVSGPSMRPLSVFSHLPAYTLPASSADCDKAVSSTAATSSETACNSDNSFEDDGDADDDDEDEEEYQSSETSSTLTTMAAVGNHATMGGATTAPSSASYNCATSLSLSVSSADVTPSPASNVTVLPLSSYGSVGSLSARSDSVASPVSDSATGHLVKLLSIGTSSVKSSPNSSYVTSRSVNSSCVTSSMNSNCVTSAVSNNPVPSSVSGYSVTSSISNHHVPSSMSSYGVTSSVSDPHVPSSVSNNCVTSSINRNNVTSSSTSTNSVTSLPLPPLSQSLPVSLPGGPPMFIMFSLRLPTSQSLAQGGHGETATLQPSVVPGPRLPPLPPFPLLLPFLPPPPPQDGRPPRPLLPFSDLSAAAASVPGGLPLPPVSFPQGLPLPPLSLQLPVSMPLQLPTSLPLQMPTALPLQPPTALPLQSPTSLPFHFQSPASLPIRLPKSSPTQVPIQIPSSLLLESPKSLPLQGPTSLPLQLSASMPPESPKLLPLQMSASLPLQLPALLPLQLPDSLSSLLSLPAPSSAVAQSSFPLPPLLLQPPPVCGSVSFPTFLPAPPSSSSAMFSCPLPSLPHHLPLSSEVQTLPFPPPQSFAAFVQSGLPLTSLSLPTSSHQPVPLPPLPPPPLPPCRLSDGGFASSQGNAQHRATVQSEPQPTLFSPTASSSVERDGVSSVYVTCGTYMSSSFPAAAASGCLPAYTSLASSSSLAPIFPFLPALPIPPPPPPPPSHSQSSSSATGDVGGFSLPLSLPPPPFSFHLRGVSPSQPPPVYASMMGQSLVPPFPGQALPPLNFLLEPVPPPAPPSLSSAFLGPTVAEDSPMETQTSSAAEGKDENVRREAGQNSQRGSEGCLNVEAVALAPASTASSSSSPGDGFIVIEEAMCVDTSREAVMAIGTSCGTPVTESLACREEAMCIDARDESQASGSLAYGEETMLIIDIDTSCEAHEVAGSLAGGEETIGILDTSGESQVADESFVPVGVVMTTSSSAGKISGAADTSEQPTGGSSVYDITDSPTLSSLYSVRSHSCGGQSRSLSPAEPQQLSSHSATAKPCHFTEMTTVAVSSVAVDPQDTSSLLQKSDSRASVCVSAMASTADQSSDSCVPSGSKVSEKTLFHQPVAAQGDADSQHQDLAMASFYQMESAQLLRQDFTALQPMSERLYPSESSLQSYSVGQKHRHTMDPNAVLLSSISDTPEPGYHHGDPFNSLHHDEHTALQLAGSSSSSSSNGSSFNADDSTKPTPISAEAHLSDSCQYHNGLRLSDFPFSAPTVSVDHPSQTLLPGVGYSPPGLSNQGLSPNLFSPMGLVSAEPGCVDKEECSLQLQAVTCAAGGGVGGGGGGGGDGGAVGGLSAVPPAVLDMLLLKADLSLVGKGSAHMASSSSSSSSATTLLQAGQYNTAHISTATAPLQTGQYNTATTPLQTGQYNAPSHLTTATQPGQYNTAHIATATTPLQAGHYNTAHIATAAVPLQAGPYNTATASLQTGPYNPAHMTAAATLQTGQYPTGFAQQQTAFPAAASETVLTTVAAFPSARASVLSTTTPPTTLQLLSKEISAAAGVSPLAAASEGTALQAGSLAGLVPGSDAGPLPIPLFSGQFCVECSKMSSEDCKHGSISYQRVADTPVLTKARATLPACLKLSQSNITGHFNTTGVYAKTPLQSKTEFGPLQGRLLPPSEATETSSFSKWKVFCEGCVRVLDVSQERESNWMMFVKPARNAMERNLLAFQRGLDLVFLASKDVAADAELLFWFAPDYCKMLYGLSKPPPFCPYCPTCSTVFYDRAELRRHSKHAHSQEVGDSGNGGGGSGSGSGSNVKKWSCSLCAVHCRSAARLNEHVMTQHMQLKPYQCPTCQKEFADPRNLKTHLLIHSGIKKFGCDTCGKHFMQKAHLQSHLSTHDKVKVKAAQCKFCSASFVRSQDMRQHELKHTRAGALGCPQCSKTFHRPELLRRHLKTVHSNERNYMCERCSKMFHTKYKLTRHGASCKSISSQPPSSKSSAMASLSTHSSSSSSGVNATTMASSLLTELGAAPRSGMESVPYASSSMIHPSSLSSTVNATTMASSLLTELGAAPRSGIESVPYASSSMIHPSSLSSTVNATTMASSLLTELGAAPRSGIESVPYASSSIHPSSLSSTVNATTMASSLLTELGVVPRSGIESVPFTSSSMNSSSSAVNTTTMASSLMTELSATTSGSIESVPYASLSINSSLSAGGNATSASSLLTELSTVPSSNSVPVVTSLPLLINGVS